jgi:predicted dithiol-disulfide oxidoreductase (DUF899 family)
VKLSELFAPGRDTLLIYNFMFPRHPDDTRPAPTEGATAMLKREEGPCPSCTVMLDQLDSTTDHLEAAGFNFVVIAKAPIDRVAAFGRERGWRRLHLLSSAGNDFKRDYHAETAEGHQMPIMTVFHRDGDGTIRHFWSSELLYAPSDPGQDPRHVGTIEPLWTMMDLTPEGRPDAYEELLDYDCCRH